MSTVCMGSEILHPKIEIVDLKNASLGTEKSVFTGGGKAQIPTAFAVLWVSFFVNMIHIQHHSAIRHLKRRNFQAIFQTFQVPAAYLDQFAGILPDDFSWEDFSEVFSQEMMQLATGFQNEPFVFLKSSIFQLKKLVFHL